MSEEDKDLPAIELEEDNSEPDTQEDTETSEDTDETEGDNTSEDAEGDEDETDSEGSADTGQPPRGAARVQKLANERKQALTEAKEAKEQVARLQKQMEEVQRTVAQRGPSAADLQAEQELLANMDPIQRVQYESDKKVALLQREIQNVQLQAKDNQDRSTFLAKIANDPVRAKYAEKVEAALADMRAKGINAPREDILYYMVGKQFFSDKAKKTSKNGDKEAAGNRVASVKAKTSSVRSDASTGRKGGKSLEDRLADVQL